MLAGGVPLRPLVYLLRNAVHGGLETARSEPEPGKGSSVVSLATFAVSSEIFIAMSVNLLQVDAD